MHPDRPPEYTAEALAALVETRFGLRLATVSPLASYDDQNALGVEPSGRRWVIKVANARERRVQLEAQNAMLAHLDAEAPELCCPRVRAALDGSTVVALEHPAGHPHFLRIMSYLEGTFLGEVATQSPALLENLGGFLGRLDTALQGFEHPGCHRTLTWDLRRTLAMSDHQHHIDNPSDRRLVEHFLLQIETDLQPLFPRLRCSVIHNDANDYNVLVDPADPNRIAGLIDFGDMLYGTTLSEVAVAGAYALLRKEDPVAAVGHVLRGYHAQVPVTELECEALLPLILARLCVSVIQSAKERKARPENTYIGVTEKDAWAALHRLAGIPPAAAAEAFRRIGGHARSAIPKRAALLQRRQDLLSPALSLQYQQPLHIVRGVGAQLYAADGRAYLDLVNNVCPVGHSHPRVVRALRDQAVLLNTNTRYLHANILDYAERLTALLPDPLSVCFFVCSGSEANELALRMARTHTGREDVVVLEAAYHGNTATLVGLSPYKYEGRGGSGPGPRVHKAPIPDPYRGIHRGPESGPAYAAEVARRVGELRSTGGVAAFLAETLLGCGGQIVPPDGFLSAAYAAVRAAGGVCIADEVQVGFGRVGSHFWGFEAQGAVPDIVTLGKPIGNGHPLAAVVTTPEIAASFHNGMEYFNTFGGNPVSCAVGLAVLDVIRDEGLQENAQAVGALLAEGLQGLAACHPLIGDVRGRGLFRGVELVRDRTSLEPADIEAAAVVEQMKARGILLSTDGPHHNVLKIKPPLVLDRPQAERVLAALDSVLSVLPRP